MSPCSEFKKLLVDVLCGDICHGDASRKAGQINILCDTENDFRSVTVLDAFGIVLETHERCQCSYEDLCSDNTRVNVVDCLFKHAAQEVSTGHSHSPPENVCGWEFLLPLTTSKATKFVNADTNQYVFLSSVALLCYTLAPDASIGILLGEETGWTEMYGYDIHTVSDVYSALVLRDVCLPFFKCLVLCAYEQVSVIESTLNIERISSQCVASGNINCLKALNDRKMLEIPHEYFWDHTDMFAGMENGVSITIRGPLTYEMISHFHLVDMEPVEFPIHIYSCVTADMFTLEECTTAINNFIIRGSFDTDEHKLFESYIHRLRILLPHVVQVKLSAPADPYVPYYWLLWILEKFNLKSEFLCYDISSYAEVTPATFDQKVNRDIFNYCDTVNDVIELYSLKDECTASPSDAIPEHIQYNVMSLIDYMYNMLKKNEIGQDRCGIACVSVSKDEIEYNNIYSETSNQFDSDMATLYANKWSLYDDITTDSILTTATIEAALDTPTNCVSCGNPVRWDNQQLCGYRGMVCDNTEH